MGNVIIQNYEIFGQTIQHVTTVQYEVSEMVSQGINDCQIQLQETETELMNSNNLLQIAFAIEAEKLALWQMAQAELAAALASMDGAWIASATAQEEYTRAEYHNAVRHREDMQRRVAMAEQCVHMANIRLEETSSVYNSYRSQLDETIHVQFGRLMQADDRIKQYLSVNQAMGPVNQKGLNENRNPYGYKIELEKKLRNYFDDLKNKSECPDTIPNRPFKASDLKKRSAEENAEMRDEFDDRKSQLKKEWEEKNGRPWPKYEKDIYSSNGKLIRRAGSDYDAHHIQPLGMGGENVASNITPLNAEVHYDKQGVHAPDSPYSQLDQMLGGADG